MTDTVRPFDEYPYLALPIDWTAPERLATASRLHGGPAPGLSGARVLELGCANGANLIPMAWFRGDEDFTGLDGSARQIERARAGARHLGLENLRFHQADFAGSDAVLEGRYDFIIVHGVLSWIDEANRQRLLRLCAKRLAPGGLLYLNYNCRPGWNVRGLVRAFLLRHTAGAGDLEARANRARELAVQVIEPLAAEEHAWTSLMANEFRIVSRNHPAYIAHEYLAPENVAWWRSEFEAMVAAHGLETVAEADYASTSQRITGQLTGLLEGGGLERRQVDDSVDLLLYRQMHSPVLTHAGFDRRPPGDGEFGAFHVAACLAPVDGGAEGAQDFRHPEGHEVEVRDPAIRDALLALREAWPRSRRIGDLLAADGEWREDVEYLARSGLARLLVAEPRDVERDPAPLHAYEAGLRGFVTDAYHDAHPVTVEKES